MVNTSTPMPIFSRSVAASLVSFCAKLLRSLFTSSTVSVPRIERKCPSRVWKITRWISSCRMPRKRSAAACFQINDHPFPHDLLDLHDGVPRPRRAVVRPGNLVHQLLSYVYAHLAHSVRRNRDHHARAAPGEIRFTHGSRGLLVVEELREVVDDSTEDHAATEPNAACGQNSITVVRG